MGQAIITRRLASVSLALYEFTTATFTNGGQEGREGPSLTQARNGLSVTGNDSWKNNTAFFNIDNGIQLWTVPQDGTYRIEAFGAGGGGNQTDNGGSGARMRGDFSLTEGEVIRILVGQQGGVQAVSGWTSAGPNSSGGNGGTFVVRSPYNTNASIAVIAGGGTGNGAYLTNPGLTGTSGGENGSGAFASGGNGGPQGTRTSGGGGFFTNGTLVTVVSRPDSNGKAFVNGGQGGAANDSCGWPLSVGGFGGGAGLGGACNPNGGSGGGYSGGAGGSNNISGSGGSYNNGTNQSNSPGVRSGHGQVIITRL